MYHVFFISFSADGHLGFSHVLAILNSTAVNTAVHISSKLWFSPGTCPGLGLLGHGLALLKEEMATYSSILAWRIPWTEEPGGLPSIWLQRVGHSWSNLVTAQHGSSIFIFWGNLHTIPYSDCANLPFHQQYKRVRFSPHSLQHLLSVDFFWWWPFWPVWGDSSW